MKVIDLKNELKTYLKPRGRVAKATNRLPGFFHRHSPVIKQIKAFSKSLHGDGERYMTINEEYALGEILFAQRIKDTPSREDYGFMGHVKEKLWGFNASSVFDGLKVLKDNNMLDDKSADRIKNSHNCVAAAEEITGKNNNRQSQA